MCSVCVFVPVKRRRGRNDRRLWKWRVCGLRYESERTDERRRMGKIGWEKRDGLVQRKWRIYIRLLAQAAFACVACFTACCLLFSFRLCVFVVIFSTKWPSKTTAVKNEGWIDILLFFGFLLLEKEKWGEKFSRRAGQINVFTCPKCKFQWLMTWKLHYFFLYMWKLLDGI